MPHVPSLRYGKMGFRQSVLMATAKCRVQRSEEIPRGSDSSLRSGFVVIRGHSRSFACHSRVIRGHSRPFAAIRGHSRAFAGIRGHSRAFAGIRGHSRAFAGIRGHSRAFAGICGHLRAFALKPDHPGPPNSPPRDAGGIESISRWLRSGATTPPEPTKEHRASRQGCQPPRAHGFTSRNSRSFALKPGTLSAEWLPVATPPPPSTTGSPATPALPSRI
jgi:hypothetical protein